MSMVSARAWSYLVRLTFRQQMVSRKNLVALLLFILLASLVFLVAYWESWNPTVFSELILLGLFGSFFVPVVALSYGTAVIGEAREGKSLVHLLARPISRAGIALGMYLSVVPLALLFNLCGLYFLCWLARLGSQEDLQRVFGIFWPGVLLATLAYLSLFLLVAVLFKHSTLIAVAYVFFVEALIGWMPGILKRISIQYYATCVALGRAGTLKIQSSELRAGIYLPIGEGAACWILCGLIVVPLTLGLWVFSRKEY